MASLDFKPAYCTHGPVYSVRRTPTGARIVRDYWYIDRRGEEDAETEDTGLSFETVEAAQDIVDVLNAVETREAYSAAMAKACAEPLIQRAA